MNHADLRIELYPKQIELGRLIEHSKSSWIGYGGSRGGGKSGSLRRLMLARRFRHRGTWGIIIRRVFDELKRNHIDELFREYPVLQDYYKVGDKELTLPDSGGSKVFFGYAETLDEVKRKFMGGQYMDVFVDQAEQFTEQELREIKQAARWPGAPVGASKLVLFFNMGGAGIQFFKRVFYIKEFKGQERPEDFAFVHAHAWDNVSWVDAALRQDGLTVRDYYGWTDDERKRYCATRSDYGINLNSQDESLIQRDWEGSWESLEGAYFGTVWDRDRAVISQDQVQRLVQYWWNRWLSMDWGRGHHSSVHWHARGLVSPEAALDILGWHIIKPIDLTVTYREYIVQGASELDLAAKISAMTPESEKRYLKNFFVSPEIFGKRSSQNTIPEQMDTILRPAGMPSCEPADNERVGGWSLMYNLLLETKRQGANGEECWIIGANCPEIVNAIPVVMRDPKNLEDIQKKPTLADDVVDDCRYGLKTGRSARRADPVEVQYAERVLTIPDYTQRHLAALKFKQEQKQRAVRSNWRTN